MAPALSVMLQSEGSIWQRQPGSLVVNTLVHWVPSAIWPTKPKTYDERLYSLLFPEHYAVDKANTQFSILGDFYSDSGTLGVCVGMFIMAFLLRKFYSSARSATRPMVVVMYALTPALLLTTFRGNIALNLGIALFLMGPAALMIRTRISE